ncbi:MAG: hypothetical protein C0594_06915 [Marinilabiliales bacterium]|nr:MAG: hypothetical protein C0594_06915 [Marinilabiliales bacterium]
MIMRSITLVIAILLGTTGLFAQNVNFHKEMDKLKSMLENVNDDLTKAVKKSKGLSKDLSVAEAKDQVNKSVKLTKNALEITDGFKKQLKKAMKEAQAWGCEKTVENSGVYEKSLKSL